MRFPTICACATFVAVVIGCGEPKPAASPGSTTGGTASGGAAPSAGAPGAAWSLEDRETWATYQKDAAEWAEHTTKKCGPTSGSWNAESFRSHMAEVTKDPHTRGRCQGGFDAVAEICGQGDMQKQAIAKRLRSIECVWGDKGKGGASIQGTKLVVTIETNNDAWTPAYVDLIRKQL